MEYQDLYPIGQQDFKDLRQGGAIYVDKTRFIEKIVKSKTKYYFLARPRRFGKSLFLSTLRYFFEGRRDLYRGLHVDSMDWDWQKYPVLHLDLNNSEYADPENLDSVISKNLRRWEKEYGVEVCDDAFPQRFETVIETIYEKTGRQVVILVDEYDKPLVKNFNEEDFDVFRRKLAELYANFKTCAEQIKLVFLTGVSRFSKLSVFSGLNNLNDITFDNEFADICGITEQEMYANFSEGIQALAEEKGISYEEACARLKKNYDGYRFAAKGSDIYNPWSLLNCLSKRDITNYWNMTGIPTLIAETLFGSKANLRESFNCVRTKKELVGLDLRNADPTALLYQTGYITVKDYDPEYEEFTLGIPNREVEEGLFDVLLPCYVEVEPSLGTSGNVVDSLVRSVRRGEPGKFMECLQAYFAGISYDLKVDAENNFQNAFYILVSLLGIYVDAEVRTSDGRIDIVMQTSRYVYIVELKYDSSAREALDQINAKQYALPYASDPRRLFKIGANFSSKSRRIQDWLVER